MHENILINNSNKKYWLLIFQAYSIYLKYLRTCSMKVSYRNMMTQLQSIFQNKNPYVLNLRIF